MWRLLPVAWVLTGGVAVAIESPKYEVVDRLGDVEVRRYEGYVVAETEVSGAQQDAGNEAFRRLAGYIFGGNTRGAKVEMTAPVTQAPAEGARIEMTAPVTQTPAAEGRWVVRFMMPSTWTLESLPAPRDARVSLKAVPPRTVAVLKYSGTWSEANYQEHLEALRSVLARNGRQAVGAPTWARYNPPWVPWFARTNEVQVELAGDAASRP